MEPFEAPWIRPCLNLFAYFFCNNIMTGEYTYTASKERVMPELMFSSECMPQLSKTASKCSGHYASLSAMFRPLHSATDEKQ